MQKRCLSFITMGILLSLTSWLSAADPADFVDVSYDPDSNSGTGNLPGLLWVPEGYSAGGAACPIVIFMHGVGANANADETNNGAQVGSHINNLVAAADANGFFVYAPQAPLYQGWEPYTIDRVMNVVAQLSTEYNLDTSRIVSTGFSMGGAGSWSTTSLYNDVLSASIPVAGALDYSNYTDTNNGTTTSELDVAVANGAMDGQPIWAFHGTQDSTVPVSQTQDMVNAILDKQGAATLTYSDPEGETVQYASGPVKYTEYGWGGHVISGSAYGTADLYPWMLAQSTPLAQPADGQTVGFDLGNTQVDEDSQGKAWNGTQDDSESTEYVTVAFAKTSDGGRTGVSLAVSDGFDGVSSNGVTSGSAYDADIAADGWYTASQGVLELTGLTPGGEYHIEIFGSTSDSAGALTSYDIGGQSVELETLGNLTDLAVFESVLADADGSLQIAVSPGTGSTYGYISSVEVSTVPEPATVSALIFGGLAMIRRRRRA